jgi:hypothetical protein
LLEASSISVDGNVLTLDPSRNFESGRRYQFMIYSSSIQDLAGNGFRWITAGNDTLNLVSDTFSIKDVTAPVATFNPEDGDDEVSRTLI